MKATKLFGLIGIAPILVGASSLAFARPLTHAVENNDSRGTLLESLRERSELEGDSLKLLEGPFGSPRYLSGELSDPRPEGMSLEAFARKFLRDNRGLFPVGLDQLRLLRITEDQVGGSHLRFDQVFHGVPVDGAKLVVHVDARGVVKAVNGTAVSGISMDVRPALSESEVATIVQDLVTDGAAEILRTRLLIVPSRAENRLAYQVHTRLEVGPRVLWIDANNGQLLRSENPMREASVTGSGINAHGEQVDLNIFRGRLFPAKVSPLFKPYVQTAGRGRYNMVDLTTQDLGYIYTYTSNETYLLDIDYVNSQDDSFDEVDNPDHPAGTSAHDYFRDTLDFYETLWNRHGLDDEGLSISAVVQVDGIPGYPLECNAGWLGYGFNFMIFGMGGDCYGYNTRPFSAALDVIGHELNHGVNEFTIDLGYNHESGALNESFADVFGVLLEAWVGELDWLIGEELFIDPEDPNSAFRDFADPASESVLMAQPDHMDVYYSAPVSYDAGGVHFNSGIINKAVYLMAAGGTFGGVTVTPFASNALDGLYVAGDLFYDVMANERISNISQFNDLRNALVDSAEQLYPDKTQTILQAFEAVGVVDDLYPTASQDYDEPNDYPGNAVALASGMSIDQYIWARNDTDIYTLDLSAGESVRVTLSNLAFEGQLNMYNYAAEATMVAVGESDNEGLADEVIEFAATTAGTYYIEVIPNNVDGSRSQKYHLAIERL